MNNNIKVQVLHFTKPIPSRLYKQTTVFQAVTKKMLPIKKQENIKRLQWFNIKIPSVTFTKCYKKM